MILTGLARIGKDAGLRYTASNEPVANLSLAFNYGRKDKKVLTGTVLGITLPTEGKPGAPIIKALTGYGLETQLVSLYVTDIIVPQAAEPLAE